MVVTEAAVVGVYWVTRNTYLCANYLILSSMRRPVREVKFMNIKKCHLLIKFIQNSEVLSPRKWNNYLHFSIALYFPGSSSGSSSGDSNSSDDESDGEKRTQVKYSFKKLFNISWGFERFLKRNWIPHAGKGFSRISIMAKWWKAKQAR